MSAAATATPPREQPAVEAAGARPRARVAEPRGAAGVALLVALLAACAYAAFANGAVALGDEAPLQAGLAVLGAVAGVLALGGGPLSARAAPLGWIAAGLLAAFAAWCAITLTWSLAPDASWQSANRALAYAVVVALALVAGASAPRGAERAARGLLAVAVAVALWALLGKTFPGLVDGTALSPRLRDPLGYWNALALLCVMGAPVAIRLAIDVARRPAARAAGLAALWLLIVVAALTYSRGGALALAAAVAALLVLGDRGLPALAALALAALFAAPGVALAFTRHALSDPASLGDRIAAGRGLAAVLAVSLVALLAAGRVVLRAEARVAWRPQWSRGIWTALAVLLAVSVIAVVASGAAASAVRDFGKADLAPSISAPSRLLSTNSGNRWTWWREAAGAWSAKPLFGHGAGSFEVLHLQYRDDLLQVRQPHDVPLQFLAETGVVGALLGLGGLVALLWAAVRGARRSPERVALVAAGAAWAVHMLVDWDWDIPGVTVFALLALGVAAAPAARGGPLRRRPAATVAAALAGWIALVSIALPALSDAKGRAALRTAAGRASPSQLRHAAAQADLAARLDPLAVEPRFAGAAIADRRGHVLEQRSLLLDAARRQPASAQAWLRLAFVAFDLGDRDGGAAAALKALALDPSNPRTRELAANAVSNLAPPADSPTATGTPLP